jgi:hypothetical protein
MYITKVMYYIKLNEAGLNRTQTAMVIKHGEDWIVNPNFIKLLFLKKVSITWG